MINKLALGTAQFGLDYGINNPAGMVPAKEVYKILTTALSGGIHTLDTAAGYGESESVLGNYLKENKNHFQIISKYLSDYSHPVDAFNESLKRLEVSSLYGYLLHHFENYLSKPVIWEEFIKIRKSQKVQKIGFSLYHIRELDILLERKLSFEILQFPYSIFDRRFEPYFKILKDRGIEIHVRSVFLQGLAFKNPKDLTGSFLKMKHKIEILRKLSENHDIPISAICLCFVMLKDPIDKIIIGVDSRKNLQENIQNLNYIKQVKEILGELDQLKEEDEKLILPMNWVKELK